MDINKYNDKLMQQSREANPRQIIIAAAQHPTFEAFAQRRNNQQGIHILGS